MAHGNRMFVAALTASLLLGCNKAEPSPSAAPEPAPVEAEPHHHATTQPAAPGEVEAPPAGAKVLFVEPSDGAEIKGKPAEDKLTVAIKMGVEGMTVKPAGEVVSGTGHHHVIIDGSPVPMGEAVPKDDTHIHFGKGQTEAELQLSPGEHTLTLQFADGIHRSYGPSMASTIKIHVAPQ